MSGPELPAAMPPGVVPREGVLEELDGTPIGPVQGASAGGGAWGASGADPPRDGSPVAGVPWRRGAAAGLAVARRRPTLWAFALVAFLARGGLVVLTLPIVVLPTFIGMANVVGPASISAAGPSPRLVALIAVAAAVAATCVLVGTIVASAAETALHRATVAPDADDAPDPAASVAAPGEADRGASFLVRPGVDPGGPSVARLVGRVVGIRLGLLVPVAVVVGVAVPAWTTTAYRELTLPSDVAAPLLLRVLAGTPAATLAVLATWLAAEIAGGFAARRAVLLDASALRALGGGLVDPLRAPLGTLLTVALALAIGALAIVPATLALGVAWDAVRHALGGEVDAPAALAAALVLAAAWIVALLLAGVSAAARATLMTAELLRRAPLGRSLADPDPTATTAVRHAIVEPPVA